MTRTFAIVERLPGHTEDMGAFLCLALELGYEPHLFFEKNDPFQTVDYFQTRFQIDADHIHDWQQIAELASKFGVILLNTSYVWLDYAPSLQQWNAHNNLIVLHHHPEDVELNPYGSSIYLTPAGGIDKWIFPLYARPSGEIDLPLGNRPLPLAEETELPELMTIGTLEGKDVGSANAYLEAGGKLVNYGRYSCAHLVNHHRRYSQHVGLNTIEMMVAIAQRPQPSFLWLPVLPPSDYAVCRFTGALVVGVDMKCVMVMPERLRELYGFPEDAVITYRTSPTEPTCRERLRASPAEQHARRRQLAQWAGQRWSRNLAVFAGLLPKVC